MYKFCTLFNSSYLSRGLAMYESLKKHCQNFHLYIFAFDQACLEILHELNLSATTIISLKEFESEELLKVKPLRTMGEYCWTCTSATIEYCLENFSLDHCTYIDADLYFYSDPAVLVEEMENNSVLITEHRYSTAYNFALKNGKYCVQFVTIKNNIDGRRVLSWWKNACLEWCYARFENGKFGDQKYLDDWPEKFQGVHVLKNRFGGIAPWNIQQYDTEKDFSSFIFFHFHGCIFLKNGKIDLGWYQLRKSDLNIIFRPYLRHLEMNRIKLEKINPQIDFHGSKLIEFQPMSIYYNLKRRLTGVYNVFNQKELLRTTDV